MKKKVLVRGPALTQSGYGEHARIVLRALRKYEDVFDIFLQPTRWGQTGVLVESKEENSWMHHLVRKTQEFQKAGGTPDVSVQVTIPNEWEKLAPVNIGVTAGIETTRIAPQWIEKCEVVDKILVPSVHAKKGFDTTTWKGTNEANQEVEAHNQTPVEVVPYAAKNIEGAPLELELDYKFNFLTVAQWGPRKNLDKTIQWFVEEFKDEKVGLVVKANTAKNNVADRMHCTERIKHLLSNYPERSCKVYLVHGNLREDEVHGLYVHPQIKAIVSTTHGEGYGLPLFEAVCHDLPVIAPNWSGHVDFLYAPKKDKKGKTKRKAHFGKVDYTIAPIQKDAVWEGVLQAESQWCYPKEASFKSLLRDTYKNYPTKKSIAVRLGTHVRKEFCEEKIYKKFADAINNSEIVEVGLEEIPKISLVTSVYDGDEFIRPFLENITTQSIFRDRCELVLVNPNSPGNEKEVIDEFMKEFPDNIKYYELDEDPGIYGTWNYAIEKSTGEFITNANLDDRKATNSLEKHAKELVGNPDIDLVYADSFITDKAHETFEQNSSNGRRYNFPQFSFENLKMTNLPHNNPMWRRRAHEKCGYFNAKYKSAGDWEMFLRMASKGSKFKKINQVLGLYYFNPKGMSTDPSNFAWKREEEKEIYQTYKDLKVEE